MHHISAPCNLTKQHQRLMLAGSSTEKSNAKTIFYGSALNWMVQPPGARSLMAVIRGQHKMKQVSRELTEPDGTAPGLLEPELEPLQWPAGP